jgi:hypothetical protein
MKTVAHVGLFLAAALVAVAAPAVAQDAAATDAPRVSMGVGTGIDRETRSLEGAADTFAAAGDTLLLWCFTLLENLEPPTRVTHAWFHEGHTEAMIELDVKSNWFRTWSNKMILPSQTGPWEVKVLDTDGTVLGTSAFLVE